MNMNEPYLTQMRTIEEKTKFHENELSKLGNSVTDISYNSHVIPSGLHGRKVYGIDYEGASLNDLQTQINRLSDSISLLTIDAEQKKTNKQEEK